MHADQILQTLKFSSGDGIPPICNHLETQRREFVNHKLLEILWASRREQSVLAKDFSRRIDSLDDSHRRLLTDGGLFFYHVHDSRPQHNSLVIESLNPFVIAEQLRQGVELNESVPACWTSDSGDYFPGSLTARGGVQPCYWEQQHKYSAPRLSNGLIVDFDSPSVRVDDPRSGILNGRYESFSCNEKVTVIEKLQETLGLIEAVSPEAYAFVSQFTKTIRVRRRGDVGYGSEQIPAEIGTIRLSNLHQPSLNNVLVAESIIHETIHNFLSILELTKGPMSLNYDFGSQARPISPWSDNPIPHASFTHAICVYYGIWNFLHRLKCSRLAIQGLNIERRILSCATGFMQGPKLNHYISFVGATHPEIAGMFHAMQRDVLATEKGLTPFDGASFAVSLKRKVG